MTDEDLIAAAVRGACPDPDVDCLELPLEECMGKHPVHEAGRTAGVIDTVEADVEGLARLVVAALRDAGRLVGPGSTGGAE